MAPYVIRVLIVFLFCIVSNFSLSIAQEWLVLDQVPAPASASGLAWDGKFLWLTTKQDVDRFYKIDSETGDVLQQFSIASPGSAFFEGLTFGEGHLFVHCIDKAAANKIFKIDPKLGQIVEVWDYNAGIGGQGIAYDTRREAIWAVQGQNDTRQPVSIVNLVRGDQVLASISNDNLMAEDTPPDGLGIANNVLFTVNNAARIFLLNAVDGSVIESFQGPGGIGIGPEGLAWDGDYLWYVDNVDRQIYKLGFLQLRDQKRELDAAANAVVSEEPHERDPSRILYASLAEGVEYRITLAGQAFKDNGQTPFDGAYVEFTDVGGLQRRFLPAGRNITFTSANGAADNFRAFLVDDTPDDNLGAFALLIEREFRIVTDIWDQASAPGRSSHLLSPLVSKPNPFNSATEITYTLKRSSEVTVEIYTSLGETVRSFSKVYRPAGSYSLQWDGSTDEADRCSAGIYFFVVQAAGESRVHKLVLR